MSSLQKWQLYLRKRGMKYEGLFKIESNSTIIHGRLVVTVVNFDRRGFFWFHNEVEDNIYQGPRTRRIETRFIFRGLKNRYITGTYFFFIFYFFLIKLVMSYVFVRDFQI